MRKILFLDPTDGPSAMLAGVKDNLDDYDHYQDFLRLLWHLRQPRQHAITVFYVPPQDGSIWNSRRCLMDVIALASLAEAVVLVISETVAITAIIDELAVLHNVIVMTPGHHNYGPGRRDFVCWQHWIHDLSLTWQDAAIRHRLDQINQTTTKEFCFEAMLGGERPYRTWLHDWIAADPDMAGSTIMSYYGSTGSAGYMLEPEVDIVQWPDPLHTGHMVSYLGVPMRLACVPPVSVYRRSWFTVLAETSAHGAWNFYTEKIAKPLLAGRVFLAVAGQHYLRGLRESGFCTFHGVIDESYDLEPDDYKRALMVFEEMRRIQQLDPGDIIQQTAWQRQHNQALAQSRDWMSDAVQQCVRITEGLTGLDQQ